MSDLARLIVRLVLGGLVAGHGAQKLFGWFGGGGREATAAMMESLELRPARGWALLAGASELGGGLLTALGMLNPLGPLGILGSMTMATRKVHWGKPIWVTSGGAELPVTNAAVALALALAGPGRYSVDRALGTGLPRWTLVAGVVGISLVMRRALSPANEPAPTSPERSPAVDLGVSEPEIEPVPA